MSKRFKVGDTVALVSDSSKVGVIREKMTNRLSHNRVEVKFLVRFGQGLNNWKECTKTELEKYGAKKLDENVYPKHYVKTYELADGRVLSLAGVVTEEQETPNIKLFINSNDEVLKNFSCLNHVVKYKRLSIGHAICNPDDKFDLEVGKKIAVKRANHHPLSSLVSDYRGEFNEDTVYAIMNAKAEFVDKEIDKFINDKVRFS